MLSRSCRFRLSRHLNLQTSRILCTFKVLIRNRPTLAAESEVANHNHNTVGLKYYLVSKYGKLAGTFPQARALRGKSVQLAVIHLKPLQVGEAMLQTLLEFVVAGLIRS